MIQPGGSLTDKLLALKANMALTILTKYGMEIADKLLPDLVKVGNIVVVPIGIQAGEALSDGYQLFCLINYF